jgi:hypothetical protein
MKSHSLDEPFFGRNDLLLKKYKGRENRCSSLPLKELKMGDCPPKIYPNDLASSW